jgi:hypothetical protein
VGVALALCGAARAQTPEEDAFKRGVSAYDRRDWKAALEEFERAYAAGKRWEILYNIGVTRRQLHRYTGAVEALRRYRDEAAKAGYEVHEARGEHELGEIALFTAEVTVQGPDGATVLLDGEEVGVTPLPGPVVISEGPRELVFRKRDYVERAVPVRVEAGQPQRIEFTLELAAPMVTIRTRPAGAALTIDGKPAGLEPFNARLGPGHHEVLANLKGYETGRADLVVASGKVAETTVVLTRAWYTNRIMWGLVVGALAAGAVTFAVLSYDRYSYDERLDVP